MQLNKLDAGKTADISGKSTVKNETVRINIQNKAKAAVYEKPILQVRSLSSLIASSGLPNDKLSANILSLARFFSLSFKPEQLAAIRKHAMMPQQPAQQIAEHSFEQIKDSGMAKSVLSLAAAAAESKGAELSAKAFEVFTEAVDPDAGKRQDNNKNKKKKNNQEQEENKKNEINAIVLKKNAIESAENNPVLSLLNKLPCKNGQRWIVLPFEFIQNGKNYRVSMRVLLEGDDAKFMVVNIQPVGADYIRPYTFAFEFINNKIKKIMYYTQDKNIESIKKELAALFGIGIEKVFVKNSGNGDMPVPEADYGEELLQFIDEEV